eukprot:Phypoly_transcript_00874.p2 GENE.Phypoly_transcript_00874~~Phypoly_transcript_00874.p2  ORF type:complete len:458 (+),score=137.31 Phypoly_transcript_00874:1-1374(+)
MAAQPSPEIAREPLARSPSSRLLKTTKAESVLQEQNEAAKLQLAEERRAILLLEEKNRGAKEELVHLTNLIKTKVLKNDEERREFVSYAQERARMRDEIDALRAQLREETAKTSAMRTEAEEARAALADHTRRTDEKERSVVRLRAALTSMEQRTSSKTNLFESDDDLSQVRSKLATKRRKYKDAKEKIAKMEKDKRSSHIKTSERDSRLETLERELRTSKNEVDELHRKVRGEVANHVSLSHDNVAMISDLEKLRKANKELRAHVEELNRQLSLLRLEQDLQGPLHVLESELSQQLDEMRALQTDESGLGSLSESTSLHTSERAIHLQLEIDKLNTELEEAQKLTKQTDSLQSKLKEAKKKNKSVKEDFTDRRKPYDLTKERSESHLLLQKSVEEPKPQHRTSSGPLLSPEDHKPENIEQLKESQKVDMFRAPLVPEDHKPENIEQLKESQKVVRK